MESQDWQDNMSRQPVLRKSENPSTSRVSSFLSSRLGRQNQRPSSLPLGQRARLTDSKDLYCVWQVESQDGLPTAFILTLQQKSIQVAKKIWEQNHLEGDTRRNSLVRDQKRLYSSIHGRMRSHMLSHSRPAQNFASWPESDVNPICTCSNSPPY